MPVANRADALESFDGISRRCALCFVINGALQSLGVPGHHAVGDEREGSGGGDEFLCSAASFGWQRLRADLPLQSVYGLAAFKHVMKRSAKFRQCEVITQMHGALQLPGGVDLVRVVRDADRWLRVWVARGEIISGTTIAAARCAR